MNLSRTHVEARLIPIILFLEHHGVLKPQIQFKNNRYGNKSSSFQDYVFKICKENMG